MANGVFDLAREIQNIDGAAMSLRSQFQAGLAGQCRTF
jgi:hypothetical protein